MGPQRWVTWLLLGLLTLRIISDSICVFTCADFASYSGSLAQTTLSTSLPIPELLHLLTIRDMSWIDLQDPSQFPITEME